MVEDFGEGGAEATVATPAPPLSRLFKEGKSSSQRRAHLMSPSLDVDEFVNLLHGSDPVKVELNWLENDVRDKDRELSEAQAEIKALRLSERLRDKVVEELHGHMCKTLSIIYCKVLSVFPSLEAARPRSKSGIQALYSLHVALEKVKNVHYMT